jgi:molybdenum cofactor cytidylyltransferase
VRNDPFVSGLVLAAGGSTRLGAAKQLLPYGSRTLLDHALDTARACHFDQLLCVIGAVAEEIRRRVDLHGIQTVENRQFGEGCSSSIAAALSAVDPRTDVLVLMLGDQPGVTASTVTTLVAGRGDAELAACAYDDGRGHPLAFARNMFPALQALHGDKGVWKLLDRHADQVLDVPIPGPVPRDVDTAEDYQALLAQPVTTRTGGRHPHI